MKREPELSEEKVQNPHQLVLAQRGHTSELPAEELQVYLHESGGDLRSSLDQLGATVGQDWLVVEKQNFATDFTGVEFLASGNREVVQVGRGSISAASRKQAEGIER